MNLKEYQQAALRTESKIEKLELNKEFVTLALKLFVVASEILDGVKKEVYYKNPKKLNEKLYTQLGEVFEHFNAMDDIENGETRGDIEVVSLDPRVFHGIVGIATEAGELAEVLVKNLEHDTPVDAINVQEELADQSWYTAILNDALNLDWEEGLQRNINKLRKRFPEKYTDENAVNRDLQAEREALEGK